MNKSHLALVLCSLSLAKKINSRTWGLHLFLRQYWSLISLFEELIQTWLVISFGAHLLTACWWPLACGAVRLASTSTSWRCRSNQHSLCSFSTLFSISLCYFSTLKVIKHITLSSPFASFFLFPRSCPFLFIDTIAWFFSRLKRESNSLLRGN